MAEGGRVHRWSGTFVVEMCLDIAIITFFIATMQPLLASFFFVAVYSTATTYIEIWLARYYSITTPHS
jgi:hypothetical protein